MKVSRFFLFFEFPFLFEFLQKHHRKNMVVRTCQVCGTKSGNKEKREKKYFFSDVLF
jgi:hypothetical protein